MSLAPGPEVVAAPPGPMGEAWERAEAAGGRGEWPRRLHAPLFDTPAAWAPVVALGAVCLYLVLSPALTSQFGPTDDHEIALMLGPDRRLPFGDVLAEIGRHLGEGNGRFRPVYWIFRVLESATWGWDPRTWYLARIALAVGTVAAAAWLASLFVPRAIAILAGIFVVVGPQAEAWFRLGPQEAYAVPLALAGLALIGRRHPAAGLILVLLASMTKEAFLPLAALAVCWAWWLGYRAQAAISALALAVIGTITAVVWISAGDYYSQSRSPDLILGEGVWMLYESAVAFGWPALLVAAGLLARRSILWRALSLLVAAIVIPQAVIYAGLGWSPLLGRYLLPAIFGLVAVAAVALGALARRHAIAGGLAMTLAGLLTLQQAIGLAPVSNGWAVSGIAFQASLAQLEVAISEHPGAVLVVRPSGVGDFEYVYALRRYVPGGIAVLDIPPTARPAPDTASPPVLGWLDERLMDELREISVNGGEGYSPWLTSTDCIELDIRSPRPDALCPIVITFY